MGLRVASTAFPLVVLLLGGPASAQGFSDQSRAPRFLVASATTVVEADIGRSPILSRRVALDLDDVTVREALAEIIRQSGLRLAFAEDVLELDAKVHLRATEISVAGALSVVLLDAGVDVVLTPTGSATLVKRPGSQRGRAETAQQRIINGLVADGRGRPLVGAVVLVVGSEIHTATDAAGRFRLETRSGGGDLSLRIAAIGYRPVVQQVKPQDASVRVVLTETAINLDEVVVTGTAGEQQARALGNVVGTVRMADVVLKTPPLDIQRMLSVNVPGVRVSLNTGEVGAGGMTRIRGSHSLSLPPDPIVYVDGVRVNGVDTDMRGVPGGLDNTGFDQRWRPSRLNDFNPEEIESIEVVKGPAAATLYGTEASNGVIQIITKRGRAAARPTVTARIRQGGAWLPNPVKLFEPTYYRNAAGQIIEFNVLQSDLDRGYPSWFRTGYAQSYGATLSGGADQFKFFFAGDFNRDEGPVTYNWKNQLTGRANLSYTPRASFSADLNLGVIRSRAQSASAHQPITTAIIWSCPAPGCGPGMPNSVDGPTRGYGGTLPETLVNDIQGFEDVNRITMGISLKHNPRSWLNQRLTVGGDFGANQATDLARAVASYGNDTPNGSKDVVSLRSTFITADYSATATVKPWSGLSLATSGGTQFNVRRSALAAAHGENFPFSTLETISAGAVRRGEETFQENRTFGVYVQEQIGWKNRLFATGAIRGDDNSAFGKNFDFVVYPKVSMAWVVSEEPFLAKTRWLTTLKLRAAYGQAGRQPDVFAALRTYVPRVGPNGQSQITLQNAGNPDLEPEVSRELEAGIDASFLDDLVSIEATYYHQKITQAIVAVPALPSTGLPGSQFTNLGALKNYGLELSIKGNLVREKNVGLELQVNYSRNQNEVIDIGRPAPIVESGGNQQFHLPGYPLASLFRKRVVSADIVQSNGRNVAANVMCEGGEVIPGTPSLSPGGGAPMPCASAPAVYWGQPLPQWDGSVHATLTLFQNLQLFALADYVGGMIEVSGDLFAAHGIFLNSKAAVERTDPIYLGYEAIGGIRQMGIFNAGFAKLRTLSASYTLPRRWARAVGGSTAVVTVAAENMATLWRAQEGTFGTRDIEPERGAQIGSASNSFTIIHQEGWPQLRRFIGTVRVTF